MWTWTREVVVRRRLFVVNDEPVALCDSYYPRETWRTGTALAEPERIAGGAYGLIEDRTGRLRRRLQRSIDDLECRMPTPEEVEALQLGSRGAGRASACGRSTTRTGVPVEVQDTVAAADKHQLRYEVTMR